ncbi:FG-GAP repeat domain-containing protein [Ottowia testudinis]|uniref:VCBS repeat-containing protein n=1 Tax=Ottowia testudinis TaxID=2816950 RepID=A0A975CFW4_9BURK|nr:hypothetical protein [Ottowia testudinis]QTD45042.1 hypothetical protein J1M35_18740 [Ottowia testudinis]
MGGFLSDATMTRSGWYSWVMVLAMALSGCQGSGSTASTGAGQPLANLQRLTISAPEAWGGEVRCGASGCQLALVEHETGFVVAHQFEGRSVRELARHPVAYHPDSAAWLKDDLFAAAVELSQGLEIFRLQAQSLVRVTQVVVGFAPRNVFVLDTEAGRYHMLVTPYSGSEVAWVSWAEDGQPARVRKARLCEAPWFPTRVTRAPGQPDAGVAVGCLDDKRVMWVSSADPSALPRMLAKFSAVPRQVRPSPSGKWLYVALETGGSNARIQMGTGELQYIKAPPTGGVAAAPMADDMVIWSDGNFLYLQRLDEQGNVLETRWLKVSGFATNLQLIDLDGDGERDLMVLNSAGKMADVIYGPLWEHASTQQPK